MKHAADIRTLFLLGLLSGCFALAWSHPSWVWWLPCSALGVSACAANHNHTHCATFRSRVANRALDLWLTWLTGTSTNGIRVAHRVRHHGSNQAPEDFVRCALVADLSPIRALLSYVPRVVAETWRNGRDDIGLGKRRRLMVLCRQERLALWCFIGLGLLLDWRRFLWAFPVPWLASQWFLVAINLPQHDGCDETSRWAPSRNVTGRFSNWLFLNNGFHTAHHERPSLHWSLLPNFHSERVASLLSPTLDCPSLLGFWFRWWKERRKGR